MELRVLGGHLSVCRLPADARWPSPSDDDSFFSVTRTPRETSVVCSTGAEPTGSLVEAGWRAMEVIGPLDFGMVGVLAGLTRALARDLVSVFVMSSYDTDYVLVKDDSLDRAALSLRRAGHDVHGDPGAGPDPASSPG